MDKNAIIGVVGAGTMGTGIAQLAAAAGHDVLIFDSREGAASEAPARIGKALDAQIAKGKLDAGARDALCARVLPLPGLDGFAPCAVVIEAIVEDLAAKQEVFTALERIVAPETILATNTSSISITALAAGLLRPERVAGMHFFNPAPIMRLVEVVSGMATAPTTADALGDLAQAWGKTAVRARSTPGFIVNRIARPYYAEALALLHERRAQPEDIDACLRGAGFRMGPCELMDLIGHDVNFAVTDSVFAAYFGDKRYAPSPVQRELIEAGRLGRKSGQGFYRYGADGKPQAAAPSPAPPPLTENLSLSGTDAVAQRLAAALAGMQRENGTETALRVGALTLWPTDGHTAGQRALQSGDPESGVFDWPLGVQPGALAVAFAPQCSAVWRAQGTAALTQAGFRPRVVADSPGLIVARTVAMLVNEAADAVQQGVCDEKAAETAMTLGVNYPVGPFTWLEAIGTRKIVAVLDALAEATRSERYRVSPYLRERLWAGAQPKA